MSERPLRQAPSHEGRKCGMTGKHRFKSLAHAQNRIAEIMEQDDSPEVMRAYGCDFCGGFHLTKKDFIPKKA